MSDEKPRGVVTELRAMLEKATPGPWKRESDWVQAIDAHGFVRPTPDNGRLILAGPAGHALHCAPTASSGCWSQSRGAR